MSLLFIVAIVVSLGSLYLVLRGFDVRLVLLSAALLIAALANNVLAVFDVFFLRMGDGQVIGPICSAMGYSFVLRATGCDREMVRLLLKPLRRFAWLLIPGGALVGFLTNMAITSQTAAAAAVGPILVPLMLAAGFHPLSAAATLVLGCSGGGNLFNPGEPDVVNIQVNTHAPTPQVLQTMILPELAGFVTALTLFWIARQRGGLSHMNAPHGSTEAVATEEPIHLLKALMPPLPVLLLFALMPGLHLVPTFNAWYPDGFPVVHAMLLSTIVIAFVVRKDLSRLTKEFFEGLGYGYVQVISLIITASCFIESLKQAKVIDVLVTQLQGGGVFAGFSSALSTMALAFVSGSGTAPSIAFSKGVLPGLLKQGMDLQQAVDLGCLGAIGATFGRTMSPVAAIVLFAATLSGTQAKDIVKHLALPLIIGVCVAVITSLVAPW